MKDISEERGNGRNRCLLQVPSKCRVWLVGDLKAPPYFRWKAIVDRVLAAILLIIGAPVIVFLIVMARLTSRGPGIYRQARVGKDGAPFTLYKIRTMRCDAEKKTGPVWAELDDPRATAFGRVLRKLRLDEFPQFLNVLKGDMSLVGPRPERPAFVTEFRGTIPLYERRLNIKPGITGWAQVKHKYDESLTDVKDKLQYDLFYLENMSIALDLKIILTTVGIVLRGKGQ